ncbi:class E basic helix-loop-helix protein 41 [Latimeria chalumnae]|uniref:Basic helix-loop-helix family member e41 n=1 Tax=Latimeria chalumnae TaxID=7897 RepID=H3AZ84_LATCH|nr:PREDICTED: class E basic helix-loop-helix protein 41 [Latimeria chalumnae]|eukprot:XP_006001768.1 PREDICTED: class E basic helix-loop-helix protein 41 [Latimeria chalumnae]
MDEGISRLQERQLLEHADFIGVEYPSLFMCKPKRGIKRDDSKEAYKLPHRLIEKKRRDRINECIAQLKDLLPEHLKLTTLGHLEKAVVLELTLKHLKALTALTEQQHQKIIALQNGDQNMKSPIQSDLDVFHSGFQTCAKEVLQYLSRFENWTPREQRTVQLINHLHTVSTQVLSNSQVLTPQISACTSGQKHNNQNLEVQKNCVPVIQRTHNVELNENDTDTDSGYGGEVEKSEGKIEREYNANKNNEMKNISIKQEPSEDPPTKKMKADISGNLPINFDHTSRPDTSIINSLMGFGNLPFGQQAPFCLPFCFISPSTAAAYMPFLDKGITEKFFYPTATPIPLLYPGIPAQAAAAFSSVLTPEKLCAASAVLSQSAPSPSQCFATPSASDTGRNVDSECPTQEPLKTGNSNP